MEKLVILIGLYLESFQFTMKFHSYIPSNIKVCEEFSFTPHIYCFIWIKDIFSAVINTVEQTGNLLKLWIRIQQYTATDFQG